MGLELRQQLKLSQQLVMTPQLQQAIKLLQLSRLELVETVQQELMENPLLDEAMDVEAKESPEAVREAEPDVPSDTGAVREFKTEEKDLLRNADWEDYLGEFSSSGRQSQLHETETPEETTSFEARLGTKTSLVGHLSWQLRLSDFTPEEMAISEVVIGNLDSTGYLKSDNVEIAEMAGCTPEEAEIVIRKIQLFDPVGVAARTPQECLLVQLEFNEYDDPVLLSLVRDHLEDLERKRYKPLMRKFRITLDDIREYLEIIQTLDPMPGAVFSSSDPYYISPDVFVHKYGDDFVVLLNEEGLPRLQLNNHYLDMIRPKSDKDKEYLQDKARSAQWLIKSLYQRQRTLYKVMESIVKFQRDFFEYGVSRLKPLILKDVSEDIGMHESTVSRITTSKYVATPHGIFELKFFFNSALGLDDGTQVGSESVKAAIKGLIAEEDDKQPLSDDRIVEILKEKLQVNIARRTVAKYRTALNIPSSSKRKQVF